MKTSLIIDLAGNLQDRARQYTQALSGMAGRANAAFAGMRSAAATAGRGMDQLAGRYTASIAGLGVTYKATQAVMDSAKLDKFLARVAITGEASAQQAASLRTELYDMSRQTGRPMQDLRIAEGVPNRVTVDTRKLLRAVARTNSTCGILAHNHPSGLALPSEADRLTTYRIMEVTGQLGFTIIDHIIVAGEDACSMLMRGSLPEYRADGGVVQAASR